VEEITALLVGTQRELTEERERAARAKAAYEAQRARAAEDVARLTEYRDSAVLAAKESGMSNRAIAAAIGLSPPAIAYILNNNE
jgi:hypothetical protein